MISHSHPALACVSSPTGIQLGMDESHLYRQIAETIRQDILTGHYSPGDRLPSVRALAQRWGCTVGTVQRAYGELARQGLVTSRAGQGTHVVETPAARQHAPLRRAALIHRSEAFLLEVLTAGYTLEEVDQAVRQAMDRWRQVESQAEEAAPEAGVLRFSGSHDLLLTWIASHFPEIAPGYSLQLSFTGSLGGLIALAEGRADMAGSHLWDAESDQYNLPYVRRVLPGRRTAVIALADRRLGLILPPGNPKGIQSLNDLAGTGIRFVNRQAGSGTRVWLDEALKKAGVDPASINGYANEKTTHSAVAQAVAEGQADAGLGLEAASLGYGLDFLFLTHERYHVVVPAEVMETPPLQDLLAWLAAPSTTQVIENLGGYDSAPTGQVAWVD
jgi:putative molybdopterin biosynthesis protein